MNARPIEIVLIEDNPNDVALTLYAFKKLNLEDRIQVVRDGAEALAFLHGTDSHTPPDSIHSPKVILLDLKLLLVSGLEVLRQIKTNPRTQSIPVVVLTSSQEECDIVESYQLGVNSYIVKPVDFDQFTEAMRVLGMYWLQYNQQPMIKRITESSS